MGEAVSDEVKAAMLAKADFAQKTVEAIEADIKDYTERRNKLAENIQKAQQSLNEINKAIFANQAMIAGIRRIQPEQPKKEQEAQA